MKRGIALLEENTEAALAEAVGLFDQALAMRRSAIQPGDHWMAYLTAASWMNRGDALARLGQPALIEEAVRSYDEALALMGAVPLEVNPLYRRRLAIAWMNRGISLHAQETPAGFAAAVKSFEKGIEVVQGRDEHALLLAGAWMNRGNALLRTAPPQPVEARNSAFTALDLLKDLEQDDVLAAETALKAQYIVCQAVAELLSDQLAADQALEMAASATDALEEAIRLARRWEGRGEVRFRPLVVDFFRFGVAAYRKLQPQFLAEFVLENLDPAPAQGWLVEDSEIHAAAVDALTAVARDLQADGFATIHTARFDRLLEVLGTLQKIGTHPGTRHVPEDSSFPRMTSR